MSNIRTNKQIFPFFNSVKEPISKPGISESFKNNGFTNMAFEVSGATAVKLVVEGCVNILDDKDLSKEDLACQWTPLALLDNSDYTVQSNVAKNGIYSIGIGGLARVRVKVESVEGALTIVGVAEA